MDESVVRRMIKEEIARLKDDAISPDDVRDDEPLFSIPGETESRIELDSLDALELAFVLEQASGRAVHLEDFDPHQLLTVDAIAGLVCRVSGNGGPASLRRRADAQETSTRPW